MEQVTRNITKRDAPPAIRRQAPCGNSQTLAATPSRRIIILKGSISLLPEEQRGIWEASYRRLPFQRYRSEGGGPKFKIGKRRVGYRVSDLQAWLDARVAQSPADARARGLAA
jgi:hypothetical protein